MFSWCLISDLLIKDIKSEYRLNPILRYILLNYKLTSDFTKNLNLSEYVLTFSDKLNRRISSKWPNFKKNAFQNISTKGGWKWEICEIYKL